tara:strand:+ start:1576 stop:4671 length:3096 start_codon:yes stop_codon:yes gene_type:complete
LIRWFTLHPIAANILMALIICAGIFATQSIRTEVIPQVQVDWLQVNIPFPGMSSHGIETQGVEQLERRIMALNGVDDVTTTIQQGQLQMQVMLNALAAKDAGIKSDVRALIDALDRPKGALSPTVFQVRIEPAVAALAIKGPHEYQDLQALSEKLKRELERLPEVGDVSFYHPSEQEATILLNINALKRFGLSAAEVGQVLRAGRQSFDVGAFEEQGISYRLLTDTSESLVSQIGNPIIRQYPNGTQVFLSDVSTIVLPTFTQGHRFNGENAVLLAVKSSRTTGLVELSNRLKQFMVEVDPILPRGVSLDVWQDTSKYYKARVEILIENGFYGFLLLFVILTLSLQWRFAFWVSLGIPVAFLGGFIVLWMTGYTLNMVSLFAFILVLGILVDDAVIVGDSIYSQQIKWLLKKQRSPLLPPYHEAAVQGVKIVVQPVVVAALTTMIMFVPLLFLPGDEGRMLRAIPAVVIATLAFSLIESLLILPAHLRNAVPVIPSPKKDVKLNSFQKGLNDFKEECVACVQWNCRHPWLMQAVFIGFFAFMMFVLASGGVRYSFFAKIEGDLAVAQVSMVEGASQSDLDAVLNRLEATALDIQQEHKHDPDTAQIKNVLRKHMPRVSGAALMGQVAIEMSTAGSRETPAEAVALAWKEAVGEIPGVDSLTIQTSLNPERNSTSFYLTSLSRQNLEQGALALGDWLRQQAGVESVELNGAQLQQQVVFDVNAYGRSLGLSPQDLAQQVRVILAEEVLYDLQTPTGQIPVKMKVSSADGVQSLRDLARIPIMTPQGQSLSLGDVATLKRDRRPLDITRHQGIPSVQVIINRTSDRAGQYWAGPLWRADLERQIQNHFQGIEFVKNMFQQEQKQIEEYLIVSFALALFCMYALMSIVLKSYWMPLLIIYAVPFGLAGAVIGHWVMHLPFTLYSMIGAFAVSGIVVNDNLVLLDRFHQRRDTGEPIMSAIVGAVSDRVRAVALTTITTVLGMVPLVLETSIQSQFLKPMAVSLAFGITTATLVTLFLVPATLALFSKRLQFDPN